MGRAGLLSLSAVSFARKPLYPFGADDTRRYMGQAAASGYQGVYTTGGTTQIAQYYARSFGYKTRIIPVRNDSSVSNARLPLLIINYRYLDYSPGFLKHYIRQDSIRTMFGTLEQSRSGLFLPSSR